MRKAELITNITTMRQGQIRRYKNISSYIKKTAAGTDTVTRELYNRQLNFKSIENLTPSKLKNLTVKQLKETYRSVGHQTGQLRQAGYINKKTGKFVNRSLKTKLTSKQLEDLEINKAVNDAQLGEDEFLEELEQYNIKKENYEKGKLTEEEFKEAQNKMSDAARTEASGGRLGGNLNSPRDSALKQKLNKNGLSNVTVKAKISDKVNDVKYLKNKEVLKYIKTAAKEGKVTFDELSKVGRATLIAKNPQLNNKSILDNTVKDRVARYDFMNLQERKRSLESYKTMKSGLVEGLKKSNLTTQTKTLMRENLKATNQILKQIKRIFGK